MRNKCPYLSTALECFAGSFGTIHCLTHDFHSKCGFRAAADKGGKRRTNDASGVHQPSINFGNPDIKILDNREGILDNLVAINF